MLLFGRELNRETVEACLKKDKLRFTHAMLILLKLEMQVLKQGAHKHSPTNLSLYISV